MSVIPSKSDSVSRDSNASVAGQWCLNALGRGYVLHLGDGGLLGRDPSADFVLTDRSVSARHAVLTVQEDRLYVRDLLSTNGTFVNGTRVTDAVEVEEGDTLHFGATVFYVATDHSTKSNTVVANVESASKEGGPKPLSEATPDDIDPWFQAICAMPECETLGHYVYCLSPVFGIDSEKQFGELVGRPEAIARYGHLRRVATLSSVEAYGSQCLFLQTHPLELRSAEFGRSLATMRESFPDLGIQLDLDVATPSQLVLQQWALLENLSVGVSYSGCSSADQLARLVVTPRSFVTLGKKVVYSAQAEPLVEAARRLQIRTIAAGVDSASMAETCVTMGFDAVRGPLFGRPARHP